MRKVEIRAGIRKKNEQKYAVATATVKEKNGLSIIRFEKKELLSEGCLEYVLIWKVLKRLLNDPYLKVLCDGEKLIEP